MINSIAPIMFVLVLYWCLLSKVLVNIPVVITHTLMNNAPFIKANPPATLPLYIFIENEKIKKKTALHSY